MQLWRQDWGTKIFQAPTSKRKKRRARTRRIMRITTPKSRCQKINAEILQTSCTTSFIILLFLLLSKQGRCPIKLKSVLYEHISLGSRNDHKSFHNISYLFDQMEIYFALRFMPSTFQLSSINDLRK